MAISVDPNMNVGGPVGMGPGPGGNVSGASSAPLPHPPAATGSAACGGNAGGGA